MDDRKMMKKFLIGIVLIILLSHFVLAIVFLGAKYMAWLAGFIL